MRTEISAQLEYLNQLGEPETELMKLAKSESQKINKDQISLSAAEGRLLKFFAALIAAEKVVEIGTLTGYSALWLLSGMKKGKFWTIEKDPTHAQIAKQIFAKFEGEVSISAIEGDARVELEKLGPFGPFDLVFIDANKSAYLDYLNWAKAHLRVGGLIIADNVFLSGSVYGAGVGDSVGGSFGNGAKFSEKQIKFMQDFNNQLMNSDQFSSVIVPTAEGLLVARRV
jgi:predicted O-methyltransferase YrrM